MVLFVIVADLWCGEEFRNSKLIDNTYDLSPLEEYCSFNNNFLEALLAQSGFENISLPLGDPEDPQRALIQVTFTQDYTDALYCNVSHYRLDTESLEVTRVTPIQREKTPLNILID